MKRALVLSGGGTAGGAWMLGLIGALRREGVDLGDADLIVGTSAGARVGAALASGGLEEAVEMYGRSEVPPVEVFAKMDDFVGASMRILGEAGDREEAARRIANLEPLGSRLASDAERRRLVAAHLPSESWPDKRLAIAAVDADSGRRDVFDRDSGVPLLEAVAASGALPGIFPLLTIDGRRYADGGVHSLYNADLAAGYDAVTVISPMPVNQYLQGLLDAETAALGEAGVRVILADEASLAAIGPNPLSTEAARAALDAGAAQGRRERQHL